MIKKYKVLRIVTYSLIGIVLMLFFGFMIIYDFSKENSFVTHASYEEAIDELDTILEDSIDKDSGISIANIELTSTYIDKLFVSFIRDGDNDSKYLYENESWMVRGLNTDFESNGFSLSIYLHHHGKIKYNIRIKLYFDFQETNNEFKLELRRLFVGSIIVPRGIIRNILSNTKEGSIGEIVNDLTELIPVGSYNNDLLSYTIEKQEISRAIELGYIGDRIFSNNKYLMDISASYMSFLFPNDMINLELGDTLKITLNYAKAINDPKVVKNDTDSTKIKDLNRLELVESNYTEYINYFLNDEAYTITSDDLKNSYLYKLSVYNKGLSSEYVSLFSSKLSIFGNELHIIEYMDIIDMYSKIDYIYTLSNGKYYLEKIEIGRDDKEKSDQYLVITNHDDINSLLRTLMSLNIETDYITYELDLFSIVGINANYESFTKNKDDSITFTLQSSEIKDMISDALLSSEFKDFIKDEIIDYQNSSKIEAIESFNNMDFLMKEKFFYFLKDFFKTETSVYNYIDNILKTNGGLQDDF